MAVTVLIVDDQPLLRTGFRMILSTDSEIHVVGEAADGHAAIIETERLRPDVVLMDVRMPGLDGVEATRRILGDGSSSRILILTTFDLDDYAFTALAAGASGFLLKDVPATELIAAIHAISSGDAVVSPRITRQLLDRYSDQLPTTHQAPSGDPLLARLTQREREVLMAIAAGLSNAEIATVLSLSEATVKTHVTRILSKLELRDRVQAVIYAYRHQLVKP
ncbi:MAG: response regulator transcription factor [Actinomycetota bacterium]|nr:response regulator transcription factor [Actinomycetota bacterium]MDQ2955932.1 response regulator transcription factor [Actinomycetota bacterium]